LTLRQKSNSLRTSKSETSWGVVTITAPSMPGGKKYHKNT
jgi:hypothetical protein